MKKIKPLFLVFIVFFSCFIVSPASSIKKDTSDSSDLDVSSFDDFLFDVEVESLTRLGQAISSSMCIVKDDEIVWSNSYGWSKLWLWQKARTDSVYLVGSVTKTVTATALLQLYDHGYFDLDDDVNDYLPFSLRNPNHPDIPITFRMVLTHTSSIYDYCIYRPWGLVDFIRSVPYQDNVIDWLREVLTPEGSLYRESYWLDSAPGEKATYSSVGFLVVGALVEQISGKSLNEYCRVNIFEPLGMYNTSYDVNSFEKRQLATPYICKMWVHIPLPHYNAGCFAPMGGLRSTCEDLGRFLIAHMNNGSYHGFQLLEEETVELMHDAKYEESINNESNLRFRVYGMGWFSCNWFSTETEGHGGMVPGGVAYMMTDTVNNTGFVMLTNHFDILGFFEPKLGLKFKFLNRVADMLLKKANEY